MAAQSTSRVVGRGLRLRWSVVSRPKGLHRVRSVPHVQKTETHSPAFSAPKTEDTACSSNCRRTARSEQAPKTNKLAGRCIKTSARDYLIFEITWLGSSSNLRDGHSESNVLVRPESLAADDKGRCGRARRLASPFASQNLRPGRRFFGPIFLFGAKTRSRWCGTP